MMKKKYQPVAWTRNVCDNENARLFMIPSLDWEMQECYFDEIARCRMEAERQSGHIDAALARRFVKVYEENARFFFLTGNSGDGIRFLYKAAMLAGSKLGSEFRRLCEETIRMAKKYSREDILCEKEVRAMLELYRYDYEELQ